MSEHPVEFFTDPIAGGRVTPRALIAPEGTISAPFDPILLEQERNGVICRLAGFGWFVFQRPGAQIAIDAKWCRERKLPASVLLSWTFDSLSLTFGTHQDHWDYPQIVAKAEPNPPPPELVAWVRSREMAAVVEFASEEEFAVRVHSSLQRFEERLRPVLSRDFFWDIQRDGNRITGRRPNSVAGRVIESKFCGGAAMGCILFAKR